MCLSSAFVNGLLPPSPSAASDPPLAANVQRVRCRRFKTGKSATDGPGCNGTLHSSGEWIISTCIKDNETKPFYRIKNAHDAIERQRLIFYVDVPFKHRIGRNHRSRPTDLYAVSSEENYRDVGMTYLIPKVTNGSPHLDNAKINTRFDDFKTGFLQKLGNSLGVVAWVSQR